MCRSSHEKKSLTIQKDFSRYGKHLSGILGFRGKPEDTLEFTKDQNIFMKQPNESEKKKSTITEIMLYNSSLRKNKKEQKWNTDPIISKIYVHSLDTKEFQKIQE